MIRPRGWIIIGTALSPAPSRGIAAGREVLADFRGVLMADRYGVYTALERERSRNGGRQAAAGAP